MPGRAAAARRTLCGCHLSFTCRLAPHATAARYCLLIRCSWRGVGYEHLESKLDKAGAPPRRASRREARREAREARSSGAEGSAAWPLLSVSS